ncbi:zinc finger and BTB domain-containing protein 49-like, partial [Contarinia nasturtii]|uniref:zinc finger and BTB domain-containing protein 49-like n=1 Tax=Contarinia nasturtii TaxID=265458 RepID=UPI0012D37777
MLAWSDEMDNMLAALDRQVKYSLKNIKMVFKHNGLSFNAEFKQYFLRTSNDRIKNTYDQFHINSMLEDQVNAGTDMNTPSADSSCIMSPIHTNSYYFNGIGNRLMDPVEILDSSDEEDQTRSQTNLKSSETTFAAYQYENDSEASEINEDFQDEEEDNFIDEMTITNLNTQSIDYYQRDVSQSSTDMDITMKFEKKEDDTVSDYWSTTSECVSTAASKNHGVGSNHEALTIKNNHRFKCQLCKYFSNHKANFNCHMRTHTGEKPYGCDICSKEFTTVQNLKRHKKTHTEQVPFHCRGCSNGFLRKVERDAHEKLCKRRRYECHICK